MEKMVKGKIVQVIGPIVDVKFENILLPELLTAIKIDNNGVELVVEVAQHVGDDVVRCVSMGPTEGLVRGQDAISTGAPISVPVGDETLGRMFNVLGQEIDGKGEIPNSVKRMPIHRSAPSFEEQ